MKLGLIISSLLYFVILMLIQNQGCNGCLEKERIGLLEIKHYILSQDEGYSYHSTEEYSYNIKELGSWVDDRDSNCCSWKRVKCSNTSSGHITELSLYLLLFETPDSKMLNVSLFRPFEELRLLDLSYNSFQGWIGNEGTTLALIYKISLLNLYKLKKFFNFYLLC
ncbi:putative leucine-rich repeat-containing, plant-type, leucine-rich repeat domain, L [Medicago truncatula]|uniref:Putative leucine-rich repeat-containing, plant-type, leucine-rich repeat domain, L n=1 Tax=Medicago truncatula TaxID=3880 RepID=A0A396HZS6_MEDTR|nr:putative leucine-rich repeat-containing, plant-type, leucine-rich repeat domain, L [Medicago truncatula]